MKAIQLLSLTLLSVFPLAAAATEFQWDLVCIKVTLGERDSRRLMDGLRELKASGPHVNPPFRKEGINLLVASQNNSDAFWSVWYLPPDWKPTREQVSWDRNASPEDQKRELSRILSDRVGLLAGEKVTVELRKSSDTVVVVRPSLIDEPLVSLARDSGVGDRAAAFATLPLGGYWLFRRDGTGEWFLRDEREEFHRRMHGGIDDVVVVFAIGYLHP